MFKLIAKETNIIKQERWKIILELLFLKTPKTKSAITLNEIKSSGIIKYKLFI